MARSFAIISSSGGIAAGTPFVKGGALFVSQASPPVAQTQRLAILEPVDTYQSIIAPGSQGGAHSFVMGEDAEDSPKGARAVLIGYQLRQNNPAGLGTQADDQVIVGNQIQVPLASRNCQGLVAVGSAMTFTVFAGVADSLGGTVILGNTAKLVCINAAGGDASNAVVIGSQASGHGGSVVIGAGAIDSDLTAVAIGQGAKAGLQAVAIGLNADSTGGRNISIGDRARGGTALSGTVIIGWFADGANSDSGIAIGQGASVNGRVASIMLGRNAAVAADHFCQIGGDATYFISELRFGAGNTQATGGQTYVLSITDVFTGAGANLQGNGLVIKSGSGTGNWANTQNRGIDLQCGLVQGSGSTQQPPTSVLALRHSDLNVALWGGLGATFQGGTKVFFVGNSTAAPVGAPTAGVILYVTAGQLFAIGASGVATLLAA